MNSIFNKVKASFKAAMKGEETTSNLIKWWGISSYLISYFVVNRIIKINNIRAIDVIISILMMIYFAWHIYVLKKCSPKKIKLTKEEKKLLRIKNREEFKKKLFRKMFLQEPISKWDPILVCMVIDVFSLATFLNYTIN
jgi:predicted membrane protein